jgi:hypothetical protein
LAAGAFLAALGLAGVFFFAAVLGVLGLGAAFAFTGLGAGAAASAAGGASAAGAGAALTFFTCRESGFRKQR